MSDTADNRFSENILRSITEEQKDQRKLLTAMEINFGVMVAQQKEQIDLNKLIAKSATDMQEMRAAFSARLDKIEGRDEQDERSALRVREEARFKMTLISVLLGGGLLQAVLSHFWK